MRKDEEGIYIDCELYVATADGRHKKKCEGLAKFYNEEKRHQEQAQGLYVLQEEMRLTALESQEQAAYFEWAAYIPELKWAHAIPNGGKRDKKEAANLKRQGVKAGVSDIFIPLARGKYHGLYIELKTKTGKPSEKQKEFIADVRKNGYAACVCYGTDEAIEATKQYLNL